MFEEIVVGIQPMTINPTNMTVSILSVPEALIAETMPNTTAENIFKNEISLDFTKGQVPDTKSLEPRDAIESWRCWR